MSTTFLFRFLYFYFVLSINWKDLKISGLFKIELKDLKLFNFLIDAYFDRTIYTCL